MKAILICICLAAGYSSLSAQIFSTEKWLEDATTIKFGKKPNKKMFSGVRIVFEPQLGALIQTTDNRIVGQNFRSLEKIGLETNLFKGYVSLQTLFVYPSTVQLDDQSPLRLNNNTLDPEGKIDVDYGFSIGLSFFDGIIAVGYGGIFYDKRDFQNAPQEFNFQNNFVYFNIQPISAVKSLIKNTR